MMTRRGRLQVTDGFWKGITDDDLGLFHAEEPRCSEVPLAADYDGLFGKDFPRAQRDIRGLVPKLPDNLFVKGEASDSEAPSEGPSDAMDDGEGPTGGSDADAGASNGSVPNEGDTAREVAELATLSCAMTTWQTRGRAPRLAGCHSGRPRQRHGQSVVRLLGREDGAGCFQPPGTGHPAAAGPAEPRRVASYLLINFLCAVSAEAMMLLDIGRRAATAAG